MSIVRISTSEIKQIEQFLANSVSEDHSALLLCFQSTFKDELATDVSHDIEQSVITQRNDAALLVRAARVAGMTRISSTIFLPPEHPLAATPIQPGPAVDFPANTTRSNIPFQPTTYPSIQHNDVPHVTLPEHLESRLFSLQTLLPHEPPMQMAEYRPIALMFRHRRALPNVRFTAPSLPRSLQHSLNMQTLADRVEVAPGILEQLSGPFEDLRKLPRALETSLIYNYLDKLLEKLKSNKYTKETPGTLFGCRCNDNMAKFLDEMTIPQTFARSLKLTETEDFIAILPVYTNRKSLWALLVLEYESQTARFYYTRRDIQGVQHAKRASRLQAFLHEHSGSHWTIINEPGLDMQDTNGGAAMSGPMILFMAVCVITKRQMSLQYVNIADVRRIRAWLLAIIEQDFELSGLLPSEQEVASET